MRSVATLCALALALVAASACDRIFPAERDTTLPPVDSVLAVYARNGIDGDVRYSGNVVELVVQQPADQLARGGQLWARVGPYIYLFTPGTREVMNRWAGIAGVRAITHVGRTEVARALLVRDALNDHTWPRALNTLGTALEGGTERPSTMDRLVQFGEQLTTFEYNTDYVPTR
jgi:hypothetical protein